MLRTKVSAVLVAAFMFAAVAPLAAGTHLTLDPEPVHAPCENVGPVDTETKGWTFSLTGVSPTLGAYELELESTYEWIAPEGYLVFGDRFSRFDGTLTTTDGDAYDVNLVWRSKVAPYHQMTQVAPVLQLTGTAEGDGETLPLSITLAFAQTPAVCEADAHAFNWMEGCFVMPSGDHACIPYGYELIFTGKTYYNGPVVFNGFLDGLPTDGAGTGHGYADVWLFGRAPF